MRQTLIGEFGDGGEAVAEDVLGLRKGRRGQRMLASAGRFRSRFFGRFGFGVLKARNRRSSHKNHRVRCCERPVVRASSCLPE